MPVVEINDLARLGQINDVAAYMLPPEAWTYAENIRYSRGAPEVLAGWARIFGTPPVPPHFAISTKDQIQTWWLYTSLTKAYVYNGSTHTEITRTSGGYNANDTWQWNGVVFGGIPILNNGIDTPQMWKGNYSTGLKLANLEAWPSGQRARIIRGYRSFLVAFNITDSTGHFEHLVHWSSQAEPGFLPDSWDYTSTTTESGRNPLPDVASGPILEAAQLGQHMYIYKEKSIWRMSYSGGQFIFNFDPFLENVGIIASRCVCSDLTGTKHVVVTQDDIIVHNGNTPESILTDRQKITLFNLINRDELDQCFLFLNRAKDEVWFVFPELGKTRATRALIWNAKAGKGAISYASRITFRNAILGDIQGVNDEAWDVESGSWDADPEPWSKLFRQKLVLCAPDPALDESYTNSRFYQLDVGTTRDGVTFAPILVREDLGVVGTKRDGGLINDFKQMKMVDSVWPKISGAPIRLRVGFREVVGGPLAWQDYTTFNPATDLWVNTIVNEELPGCGKAVSIEFSALTAETWRLDGYSMNVEVLGPY